jgi:hypothetical protein
MVMAGQQKWIDVTMAAINPSKYFASPQEVLTHPELTREHKLKILRQWEVDARLLQVAEEENMSEGESSHLGSVVSALIALDDENKRPDTEPERKPH